MATVEFEFWKFLLAKIHYSDAMSLNSCQGKNKDNNNDNNNDEKRKPEKINACVKTDRQIYTSGYNFTHHTIQF